MTGIKVIADALSVSTSMKKIKVNKCELPIDVLKTGVEVDLSGQELQVEDAIIIAACIKFSTSMTFLNLSSNCLCGLNEYGGGTYDATGIKAIADALSVSTSMTSLE